MLENTLIIFMSDNGMTGGGSGRPGKALGKQSDGTEMFLYNADMKGQKGSTDEGGVRVPFFVRWDGHVKAGQDVDRIAAHIDVFPTIAALAGARLPEGQVEGRSLLPLLESPQVDWQDRYLFTHKCRWPTGEDPGKSQWKDFAVRNQQYRFVDNTALYDMQADPSQTNNMFDDHPDVVETMRKEYDNWWKTTRPLMVNEDAPMSPTQPYTEAYNKQKATQGIPPWNPPAL